MVHQSVDCSLEGKFAACDLQFLDEVGGAGDEDAPDFRDRAILDQAKADGGGQMGFAAAGRPDRIRLAPVSSQLSPATSAMTRAVEMVGTAPKSKPGR